MARVAQTYVNTVVFAIVAGIVSIALLIVLMMSESLTAYLFAIVTIEVGLLVIIINALYRIIAYEKNMRKAINNASKNSFAAENCPDYYTMRFSAGPDGNSCKNMFLGTTPERAPFAMYYVPSPTYQSTGQGTSVIFAGNPPNDNINMASMQTMKMPDACKSVQGLPAEADDKKSPNNYNVPWTDLRPKCESIVYY